LVQPNEEKRISKRNCGEIDQMDQTIPDAKTSVIEQPTIAVNRRGGLPIQYIIQAPNFKTRRKNSVFMDEVSKMKHLPLVM
jgi:HAE1 family hydrophobic/amphiphilic exporter-1/multidrug efflux pump